MLNHPRGYAPTCDIKFGSQLPSRLCEGPDHALKCDLATANNTMYSQIVPIVEMLCVSSFKTGLMREYGQLTTSVSALWLIVPVVDQPCC